MIDVIKNSNPWRPRVMVGTPTTGVIRYEWHSAYANIIIPTNWQARAVAVPISSPLGYSVAEGRNLIVRNFLQTDYEWLFFIDHDVICPPNTFIWLDDLMRKAESPIIGGLYYTKGYPAEPLVYLGHGNGPYKKFKLGEKVWCDGLGMGFTAIHRELLQVMWRISPLLKYNDKSTARNVFQTPRRTWVDPETHLWVKEIGTEDLNFCSRVIKEGLAKTTTWKHLAKKKYPFLIDTTMFCWHMDMNGTTYPLDIDLPPGFEPWKQHLETFKWSSKG